MSRLFEIRGKDRQKIRIIIIFEETKDYMPIEGTHSVDLDGQYSDLYALQHAIKESLEA